MKSNAARILVVVLLVTILISIIGWVFVSVRSMMCDVRWNGSGMATEYGLIQGCRVQHEG